MPLPITIPNTFANATATIPLSQLDSNFSTVAVAVNSIGNGAFSLANVQVTGGKIANVTLDNVSVDVETLSNVTINGLTVNGAANLANANVTFANGAVNNAALANSTVVLGNTTVALGNTVTSLGNVTLVNTTVNNYTETLYSVTGNVTISLSNGTIQKVTTNGATTITLPSSVSGKSFSVLVYYAAADALTWAGGSTLKWSQGTTPTPTSATGKYDLFSFVQDGTNTYGIVNGQNY